jgi:hypothetical protein
MSDVPPSKTTYIPLCLQNPLDVATYPSDPLWTLRTSQKHTHPWIELPIFAYAHGNHAQHKPYATRCDFSALN